MYLGQFNTIILISLGSTGRGHYVLQGTPSYLFVITYK